MGDVLFAALKVGEVVLDFGLEIYQKIRSRLSGNDEGEPENTE